MTSVEERIQCRWCHAQSPSSARTCDRCGAPLDVRDTVSDSGWREAPRLRDLTEVHWASSSCQLDAGVVPVVEVALAEADSVFFEHHAMLWKDETVPMSVMSTPGGAKRLLSGLPFVLSVARGPGRVALSRDAPGELIVLPVDPSKEIDVREHALVLASGTLTYSFEKLPGLRAMLAAGTGMYLDRYVAQSGPGLLVLHGYGDVFERTLGEGETILVNPGAFFYKDSSVTMEVVSVNFKANFDGAVAQAGGRRPVTARGRRRPGGAGGTARRRRTATGPTGPAGRHVRPGPAGPEGGEVAAQRRGVDIGSREPPLGRWVAGGGGRPSRRRWFIAPANERAGASGDPVHVQVPQKRVTPDRDRRRDRDVLAIAPDAAALPSLGAPALGCSLAPSGNVTEILTKGLSNRD